MKTRLLILLYLFAIIAANLIITTYGPAASIITAFFLIGLDLTSRDALHEAWQGRGLPWKMALLIGAGSILSYLLNQNAGPIALASFGAFALSGLTDTLGYSLLGNRARRVRVNGSNVLSAGVDSVVFLSLAFGWPPLWGIVAGQWLAKVAGGFIWSWVVFK